MNNNTIKRIKYGLDNSFKPPYWKTILLPLKALRFVVNMLLGIHNAEDKLIMSMKSWTKIQIRLADNKKKSNSVINPDATTKKQYDSTTFLKPTIETEMFSHSNSCFQYNEVPLILNTIALPAGSRLISGLKNYFNIIIFRPNDAASIIDQFSPDLVLFDVSSTTGLGPWYGLGAIGDAGRWADAQKVIALAENKNLPLVFCRNEQSDQLFLSELFSSYQVKKLTIGEKRKLYIPPIDLIEFSFYLSKAKKTSVSTEPIIFSNSFGDYDLKPSSNGKIMQFPSNLCERVEFYKTTNLLDLRNLNPSLRFEILIESTLARVKCIVGDIYEDLPTELKLFAGKNQANSQNISKNTYSAAIHWIVINCSPSLWTQRLLSPVNTAINLKTIPQLDLVLSCNSLTQVIQNMSGIKEAAQLFDGIRFLFKETILESDVRRIFQEEFTSDMEKNALRNSIYYSYDIFPTNSYHIPNAENWVLDLQSMTDLEAANALAVYRFFGDRAFQDYAKKAPILSPNSTATLSKKNRYFRIAGDVNEL